MFICVKVLILRMVTWPNTSMMVTEPDSTRRPCTNVMMDIISATPGYPPCSVRTVPGEERCHGVTWRGHPRSLTPPGTGVTRVTWVSAASCVTPRLEWRTNFVTVILDTSSPRMDTRVWMWTSVTSTMEAVTSCVTIDLEPSCVSVILATVAPSLVWISTNVSWIMDMVPVRTPALTRMEDIRHGST